MYRLEPSTAWTLVDLDLADPYRRGVAERLLDLVNSNWSADVRFDLDDVPTERFLTKHRVSTLLSTHHFPPSQQAAFRHRLLTISGVQLRIESAAIHVLEVLNAAGIESRVLKGLASAELDYPDRRFRQTGDVDLVVPVDQLDDAIRALKSQGHSDHPSVDHAHLTKGETLVSPTGIEIDMHSRLFRRSPFDPIVFDADPEPLRDLPGTALGPHQRLVHAAGHFIITPPGFRRMSGLIDITMIHAHPRLDFAEARRFAAALGVEALTGAALRLEAKLSGRTDVLETLESWHRPDWLDRATRMTSTRRLALEQLARLREMPRTERLRALPRLLTPDTRQRTMLRRSIAEVVQRRQR